MRLAFGLARGQPDNEQGWVAVSNDLVSSQVVATADAGAYYKPEAWLDANTLLVEAVDINGGGSTTLWRIAADGSSAPVKLADGEFVQMVP